MIKNGRYRVIGLTFKITLSMYRKWVDRVEGSGFLLGNAMINHGNSLDQTDTTQITKLKKPFLAQCMCIIAFILQVLRHEFKI